MSMLDSIYLESWHHDVVTACLGELSKLREHIDSNHIYAISFTYNDIGLISHIIINY